MAKLSSYNIADMPQKVLVFGAPKSGKSLLVGRLAEAGYNLLWFDMENGAEVLFQLSEEAQERVTLYRVADKKADPQAAKLINEFYSGRNFSVCATHGKVNCVNCKAKGGEVTLFDFDAVGENDIVVFDSGSQIVTSVQNHIARNDKFEDFGAINKESKHEWGHYNAQRLILDAFFTDIQSSRFKIVMITHEQELDVEKNPTSKPVNPLGGTTKQSKTVGKFFGHIVHCRLRSNNHQLISQTTSDTTTVAGSRLNIDVSKVGLAGIFKGEGNYVKPLAEDSQVTETEINETTGEVVKSNNATASSQLDAIRARMKK